MLQRVARVCRGAGRDLPILTAFTSALLLSSCGSFDLFHAGETRVAETAAPTPPPALRSAVDAVETVFWPTHGWRTSSPEAQGIDSAALASTLDTIRARHIPVDSLLIERHGSIVLDAYFHPYTEHDARNVASVTKSVTSTLVGIAMGEHKLDTLEAPITTLLPDAGVGSDKANITLAHLLSMTSGLDCSDTGGRNFLQQMEASRHWASFALDRREAAEPGSTFTYCAGNMHLVSAVLTRATGESAADYARDKLFAPLGIEQVSWPKDADGISHGFADMKITPRDMAKLGYLWLHHGQWDGKQIVPAEYLAAAFSAHANVEPNVQYGYGMWIYPQHGHAGGPADFEANGTGGQRIAVIPTQDMVVVITGDGLDANDVAGLLTDIVKSDRALPEDVIASSRLAVRVSEAESGTTYAVASVVPTPRPDVADDSAQIVVASNLGNPAVVPLPRPDVVSAVARNADIPRIVPRPRPDTGATAALTSPASTLAAALATTLPRPRPSL